MDYQIAIYSTDAVFARMLELEFSMCGARVLTAKQPMREGFSDVVLLDLDSAAAPDPKTYRRMIGFTRGESLSDNELRRQCSLVLHRPFEMRLFRREVRGLLEDASQTTRATETIRLQGNTLYVGQGSVTLSPKEALVMQCLMENRPLSVSRETLAARIGESSANKVEVYVCYLRKKTETLCRQRLIRTVRGVGYSLAEQT